MLEFIKEFYLFLKERRKWWLLPIAVMLFVAGTLLFLAQGTVVAPFIYTLF